MGRKIWTFILCLWNVFSFGQALDNSCWILKGNIAAPLDIFTFPRAEFSLERNIKNKFAICGEAGLQLQDVHRADTLILASKGFKANMEIRCYLDSLDPYTSIKGVYIGLQPFYRYNQYTRQFYYFKEPDSLFQDIYYDCIGIRKSAYGVNINLGYQQRIVRRIVLDMYCGVGIMKKGIKNFDRQYNQEQGDFFFEGPDWHPNKHGTI